MAAGTASAAEPSPKHRMGIVIHSYAARKFPDPLLFVEYCRSLGAGGVQIGFGARDDAAVDRIREAARAGNMYLEGIASLPRSASDVDRFAAELRTAQACGATVVRTVMLSGRRYETFDSADAFRQFADESWQRLLLAKPVVEKLGVRLAVENHKDWQADDLVKIIRRADSPNIGVTVDTGNNIALLEEPHEVVEALAPYAFTVHFKDMGVTEYADGYLLAEVPFGTGFLDLPRIVRLLRDKQPDIHFNLEMMTRDPLKVPCLTEKYWATFESLPGEHLAAALSMVRKNAAKQPLMVITEKSPAERMTIEDENVRRCIEYARMRLAM
jgi:3-oxoisoapionate decarboxylase